MKASHLKLTLPITIKVHLLLLMLISVKSKTYSQCVVPSMKDRFLLSRPVSPHHSLLLKWGEGSRSWYGCDFPWRKWSKGTQHSQLMSDFKWCNVPGSLWLISSETILARPLKQKRTWNKQLQTNIEMCKFQNSKPQNFKNASTHNSV